MDCRLVLLVKLVKKVTPAVSNAPVVPLVNRVRVITVLVKHARKVNLVNPMIQRLILAHHVNPATIKMIRVKHLVCRAFPERIKTIPGDNRAKSVQKTHSTIHRLLSFAMLAVLVNTPPCRAMLNALHARPEKREHLVHHVI